jgi:hypothetical protein
MEYVGDDGKYLVDKKGSAEVRVPAKVYLKLDCDEKEKCEKPTEFETRYILKPSQARDNKNNQSSGSTQKR